MAGEEHRHHLVADVAVREAAAALVLGVEQQREEILPALAGGAPPGDLAEHERVEPRAGALHAPPTASAGRAAPAASSRGRSTPSARSNSRAGSRSARAPVGVEAEQRAHRDAERELAGPAVELHLVAGPPRRDGALDLLLHRRQRGGDPLASGRRAA